MSAILRPPTWNDVGIGVQATCTYLNPTSRRVDVASTCSTFSRCSNAARCEVNRPSLRVASVTTACTNPVETRAPHRLPSSRETRANGRNCAPHPYTAAAFTLGPYWVPRRPRRLTNQRAPAPHRHGLMLGDHDLRLRQFEHLRPLAGELHRVAKIRTADRVHTPVRPVNHQAIRVGTSANVDPATQAAYPGADQAPPFGFGVCQPNPCPLTSHVDRATESTHPCGSTAFGHPKDDPCGPGTSRGHQ